MLLLLHALIYITRRLCPEILILSETSATWLRLQKTSEISPRLNYFTDAC